MQFWGFLGQKQEMVSIDRNLCIFSHTQILTSWVQQVINDLVTKI